MTKSASPDTREQPFDEWLDWHCAAFEADASSTFGQKGSRRVVREIRRLQAEIREWDFAVNYWKIKAEKVQAEVERLRAEVGAERKNAALLERDLEEYRKRIS